MCFPDGLSQLGMSFDHAGCRALSALEVHAAIGYNLGMQVHFLGAGCAQRPRWNAFRLFKFFALSTVEGPLAFTTVFAAHCAVVDRMATPAGDLVVARPKQEQILTVPATARADRQTRVDAELGMQLD